MSVIKNTQSQFPPGFRSVQRRFESEFYKFMTPGQTLDGFLASPTLIKDRARFVLEDTAGQRWILPSHADLESKLVDLPVGAHVLIRFSGLESTKTKRGLVNMYRYEVGVDEKTTAASLDDAAAAEDNDVPF